MSNHIVDFISAAVQDKPAAATNAFRDEIEDRIDAKLADFQETIRQNMFASEAALEEQFSSWTVAVIKPINKLKKGQTQTVQARSAGEAMKKAAAKMGEPTLGSANLKVMKKEEFEGEAE